jgi:hypothetical protein
MNEYEKTWDACVAKHRRDLEQQTRPRWLARVRLWFFDRRMARTRDRMVAELERRIIGRFVGR